MSEEDLKDQRIPQIKKNKEKAKEDKKKAKDKQLFIKEFETYLSRQAFEHELINRRVTWLLSSQTILFAALALAIGKEGYDDHKGLFLIPISILGILISSLIFFGIRIGIKAKRLNYEKFKAEYDDQAKLTRYWQCKDEIQWGVETRLTKLALVPDIVMPIVFALAWLCILILFS